jgi:hypothetical protein
VLKRLFIHFFLLVSAGDLFSQASNYNLINEYYYAVSPQVNRLNSHFHESVKPYLYSELNQVMNLDSLQFSQNKLKRIFKNDTNNRDISIEAFPLLGATTTIENGRFLPQFYGGASIQGAIKSKLYLNMYYTAHQGNYASYILDDIQQREVILGGGRAYANASGLHQRYWGGYLSYSPNDVFNFQLGNGKNFFGSGYRSLLLSDAPNNYNYFRITTNIWKIKYVNLYTQMKDIYSGGLNQNYWQLPNKYGTFHYLSWNMTKRINLSFFENVIWGGKDTMMNRGFDVNYLNPVIFYRPVEYATGSSDNSQIGLNYSYKASNKIQFYGQISLDEFYLKEVRKDVFMALVRTLGINYTPNFHYGWWANKQAYQFGVKWFDAFFLKNLQLQMEYNIVRPFTYSHFNGLSNYGHYGTSLAHPYGANFKEGIYMLNYSHKNWIFSFKHLLATIGKDTANMNFGNDIYKPYNTRNGEYFHFLGQGEQNRLVFTEFKVNYIIYPKINLQMELGVRNRIVTTPNKSEASFMIIFGLKTALFNVYDDF